MCDDDGGDGDRVPAYHVTARLTRSPSAVAGNERKREGERARERERETGKNRQRTLLMH